MNESQSFSEWELPDDLYASGSLRGSYHSMQFVVRLNPKLRASLDSIQPGVFSGEQASSEAILAFSTLFHETIHWWQHVGSTTGLMLSFAYPAQFHVNMKHLRIALEAVGPKKSLKTLLASNHDIPEESQDYLNIIVNNWHDVEFNRRLILDPLKAEPVVNSPFFESVGHSLKMGLSHTLWLLGASFDQEMKFLPDPRKWDSGFADLRNRKVKDYYYGSPIQLFPLGAVRIFEGQARFSQLQYLHLSSDGKVTWAEFESMGMMGTLYVEAFRLFLLWAEIDRPATVVDPVVHLFLLVCDLAINPSDGFPFELLHFASFVVSNDPSIRFYYFCRYIAGNTHLKTSIRNCSREEYVSTANVLCKAMICKTPVEIGERIDQWARNEPTIRKLLEEDESFAFVNENLPVRLCFARYIRFMQDKAVRPEFFCWPAMFLVSPRKREVDLAASGELWSRHEALFIADLEGEIRPRLLAGRKQNNVQTAFNEFYRWNLLYDFVRQWTVVDGPFDYDFRWLTPKYFGKTVKPFVDDMFKQTFGVAPDDFSGPN